MFLVSPLLISFSSISLAGLKSNEVTEPSSGLADHQLFVQPEQQSEEELSEEQEDEEESNEEEQAPINRFRGLYII